MTLPRSTRLERRARLKDGPKAALKASGGKRPPKAGSALTRDPGAKLARSGRLATRTRIRARAATPKRWTLARTDDAFRGWIRGLPCLVACNGCWGPVDPHHVKTRGAGGADRRNLVPLCRTHHDALHQLGRKTFAAMYRIQLSGEAVRLDAEYEQSNPKERAA